MTSKNLYQDFINGLNYGRVEKVVPMSDLKLHMVVDAHAMSGSDTEKIVSSLLNDGVISKKDGKIDLTNLYDGSRFVMKGKSGKKLKSKPGTTGIRTVKYVAPGHTQVNYAHRILDIRFKETDKEFKDKARLRRIHAAKKGAKTRGQSVDQIYVDRDEYGNMAYVTKTGRTADDKSRSRTERGIKTIRKTKLKKDAYSIEDMRALLRDDHWEEVCGHKRWNYDNSSTVKEFNKYLKRKKR